MEGIKRGRSQQSPKLFEAPRPGLGFPKRKFRSYCAPSCLPVGRDPSCKAGLTGHVPAKSCDQALLADQTFSMTENNFLFLIRQKKYFQESDFFYRLVRQTSLGVLQ